MRYITQLGVEGIWAGGGAGGAGGDGAGDVVWEGVGMGTGIGTITGGGAGGDDTDCVGAADGDSVRKVLTALQAL